MKLIVVGPGRAGTSFARASVEAGHHLVGVLSRSPSDLGPACAWGEPLPECDLVLLAVSDDAIGEVAEALAPICPPGAVVAHLSGFVSVSRLDRLGKDRVGSLHPLQTLPDGERGARSLRGAGAAVTARTDVVSDLLYEFALSLGMRPFLLDDQMKSTYHAGAAAAANYVAESLAVAFDLLAASGVAPGSVEPLTRTVVDNAFAIGADAALTGPIVRGDLATVDGQMAAADAVSVSVGKQFRLLSLATAERVGVEL